MVRVSEDGESKCKRDGKKKRSRNVRNKREVEKEKILKSYQRVGG